MVQKRAEEHNDRMYCQQRLAFAYRINGQLSEAITMLQAAVKIAQQNWTEDHFIRIGAEYALALAYH